MSYESEYCDHCGSKITIDEVNAVSELKCDIDSANKGESGILCSMCYKDYENNELQTFK